MFDLMVGVGSQHREIRLKGAGCGGGNPLRETTVNIIALVVIERHAGAAIEKFAKAPNILLGNWNGNRSLSTLEMPLRP